MSETWLVMTGYHQGRFDDGDSPQCIHASEADAVACAERHARGYERQGPRHWKHGNASVWVVQVHACRSIVGIGGVMWRPFTGVVRPSGGSA